MERNARRGQALVEITLVWLALFLLMAGTVDVARLVTGYTYLNNAAQEGAIYGVLYPTDITGIRSRVKDSLKSMFAPDQVTVTVAYNAQSCPGHLIEVQVSADMEMIFPFAELFVPSRTITLTTTAQQIILRSESSTCY